MTGVIALHIAVVSALGMGQKPQSDVQPPPPIIIDLTPPPAPPPTAPIAPIPSSEAPPSTSQADDSPAPAPAETAPRQSPPATQASRPRVVLENAPPDVNPIVTPINAASPTGLPLLGAADLAGAARVGPGSGGAGQPGSGGSGRGASGQGVGGQPCDMIRWLQDAVRDDQAVRRAVASANQSMNASGRAILVWNGDWLQSRGQEGKGLAGVRQAIALEVAFAPEECRNQRVQGLVVLALEDGSDAGRLALGRPSWRWADLLNR